jgi:hypothetical protein
LLAAFALLAALSSGRTALAQSTGGVPPPASDASTPMQGALLADPASREQVMSLQDDPLVQSILNDPATMRAVQSGDLGALMANPKIQALSQNPTVRSLVEQQTR